MRIQKAIESRRRSRYIGRRIGRDYGRPGRAKGGKGPVAAKAGTAGVGGYNSEMIKVARTQAADVGSDRQRRISTFSLRRSGVPVAGCGAPLEMDRGGRLTRID